MTKCGDVKLLAGVIPQEEETDERERENVCVDIQQCLSNQQGIERNKTHTNV